MSIDHPTSALDRALGAEERANERVCTLEDLIAALRGNLIAAIKKDCEVSVGRPAGTRAKKLKFTDAQALQMLAVRFPNLSEALK